LPNRFASRPRTTGLIVALTLLAVLEAAGHLSYRVRHGHFLWRQPVLALFDAYSLDRYPPNLSAEQAPWGLGTDRYGFVHNGYERDIAKRGDRFLIFMLGGSTVEGLGVKNGETIAAQLENILNAGGRGSYWVVNAGYHGQVSYQQQGVLAGRIASRFKPDLVIALDGRNDGAVGTGYGAWRPNWEPYVDVVEAGVNAMRDPPLLAGLPEWLLRHSSIVKLASAARYRATGEARDGLARPDLLEPAKDPVVDEVAAAYFANHAAALARCKELGYPYAAFLQPTLIASLRPRMSEAEKAAIRGVEARSYLREGVYTAGLERFYAKASLRARGRSWFHDLSRLFADSEGGLYVDSCHYSKEGGRRIAQKMADILAEGGLLSKRR
jgi:hypothetical protein